MTEITAVRSGLWDLARRRLRRSVTPPTLRQQIVLMLSAFVLGAVLCAAVFVGVWRDSAADGERAHAAQVATTQALRAAQQALRAGEAKLVKMRAAVVKLRAERKRTAADLVRLERANVRAASVAPRLRTISSRAQALAHEAGKVRSALTSINGYVRNSATAGLDPAFLNAQITYLIRSAGATSAAATTIASEAEQAEASAAALKKK